MYTHTHTHTEDDLKHNSDECKYLKNGSFNLFAQHPLPYHCNNFTTDRGWLSVQIFECVH